jgi:hypothetical protein
MLAFSALKQFQAFSKVQGFQCFSLQSLQGVFDRLSMIRAA